MNMSENRKKKSTFFVFMEDVSVNLKTLGKIRTSETYKSSLDSCIYYSIYNGKHDSYLHE